MTCSTTGYTGQNFCNKKSRFGKPTGIIFARNSHTETAENFLLEASWVEEVQAQNVFPLHFMRNFEDLSTEAQYHEYPDGSRKLMEQGDYRFAASFDLNECIKKQLINFRGFNEGFYLVYGDVIRGRTIDSGTNIVPVRIGELNIEKATLPAMDGTPEMVRVVIDVEDERDLNDYDYSREMTWDVKDVDGLTPVNLAINGTPTATEIVIDISADCGGNKKEISGIYTDDMTSFSISGDGTLTSVTESATVRGRYTFVTSGLANDDEISLVSPATRSDDVLVIGSAALTVSGIA